MADHYFYLSVTLLFLVDHVLVAKIIGPRSHLIVDLPVGIYFLSLAAFMRLRDIEGATTIIFLLNIVLTAGLYLYGRTRTQIKYEPLWVVLRHDKERGRLARGEGGSSKENSR